MASILKSLFSSKPKKSKKKTSNGDVFQDSADYSIPSTSSTRLSATAAYHSTNAKPLPKGPKSAHGYTSLSKPSRSSRMAPRASSTENLNGHRSRRVDFREANNSTHYPIDSPLQRRRRSRSRYAESDSEDSSPEWMHKMQGLEYENRVLRQKLKHINKMKDVSEKAFMNQVEYQRSNMMTEQQRMCERIRMLEEQLSSTMRVTPTGHPMMKQPSYPFQYTMPQDDTPASTPFGDEDFNPRFAAPPCQPPSFCPDHQDHLPGHQARFPDHQARFPDHQASAHQQDHRPHFGASD